MKPGQTPVGAPTYTCPMHPDIEQHHPGKCPKCGMALVPKTEADMKNHAGGHDYTQMTREMREQWLWTNFTIMSLGLWLISSPVTFGYKSLAMCSSDMLSGAALSFFAALARWPRFDFLGRWSVAMVGTWLQLAPLVFWAPTAAAYINDTLIGALALALSILVPMMPGMAHHRAMMKPGPQIPPGWTHNPSSWHQRAPMIGLALVGWFISRYLAAFQLGYIPHAWDPFFGESTVKVLTSDISKMMPISDAGMGALAYTLEMLMGWMGGKERWRIMPWMVTFFFILVVPLGIVHIMLVILQPVAVGHWCTLCVAAATVMLLMIPLAVDEVIAMGQFMRDSVRNGKPFWRTFWVGDTIEGGANDERTPHYGAPLSRVAPSQCWGVTVPWTLAVSAVLGVWLLAAPAVLGAHGPAADSDHLVGAVVLTVVATALAEVTRAARYLNVLCGAWLILAPWLLTGDSAAARWNDVAVGLALILLGLPRGPVRERYGGWDRYVV